MHSVGQVIKDLERSAVELHRIARRLCKAGELDAARSCYLMANRLDKKQDEIKKRYGT